MDELKRWYRDGLPTRIEALQEALSEARAGGSGEERGAPPVDSIRRLARTLARSAETYGFPEIAQAAHAVEAAGDESAARAAGSLLDVLRRVEAAGRERGARVLVVDADAEARPLVEALAAPGREVLSLPTAAAAERFLAGEDVSLVLLALVLADGDGRDLLLRLRERPSTAALPVFVLSGTGGRRPRSECLALGADAYFEKPLDLGAVAGAVRRALEHAERDPRQDPLTGLPSRAALREALGRARDDAARGGLPLSLALLELDRFHAVNEVHGVAAGDEVLRAAAQRVAQALRPGDTLARWSGVAFAALLPGADETTAAALLEGALEALRREPVRAPGGAAVALAFSAGVAQLREGEPSEGALGRVERLLYRAASAGGSRVLQAREAAPGAPRRILFAEDDEDTADLVKTVLAAEGLDVVHVPDGAQALAAAPRAEASLVLLDVMMPHVDGFGVLARLRQDPAYAHTPIVMLTAMGGEENVARGFSLGADDYILKPFRPSELVARVRRLLR